MRSLISSVLDLIVIGILAVTLVGLVILRAVWRFACVVLQIVYTMLVLGVAYELVQHFAFPKLPALL